MANVPAGKIEWNGKALIEALKDGGDDAMFEAGQMVLDAAKAKVAPMRFTGRLERSGYVSTNSKSTFIKRRGHKKERKPDKPFGAVVAFAAPHSHLVEFGTTKMAAKPYLRPAIDGLKEQVGDVITVGLTRALNKKLKKAKR